MTTTDTWATSTDPAELLRLAGPLTRTEAAAIVSAAYERVEHLVTAEERRDKPSPLVFPENAARCLAWAAQVERGAAKAWAAPAEPPYSTGAVSYAEHAARAAHVAIIRRCVRWPR